MKVLKDSVTKLLNKLEPQPKPTIAAISKQKCFGCDSTQHFMAQCPNLAQQFRQTPHIPKNNQLAQTAQQPKEICGFCGTPGHTMMTCRKWKRIQETTTTQGLAPKYCQKCQRQGHDASECRSSLRTGRSTTQDGAPICHYCNKRGHIRRHYSFLNGQGLNNTSNQRQVRFSNNTGYTNHTPGGGQTTQS